MALREEDAVYTLQSVQLSYRVRQITWDIHVDVFLKKKE